jgi:inhibitor of KinA
MVLMEQTSPYEVFSIGDSALTFDLGNKICGELNQKVIAMQDWFLQYPFEGMKDVILGYSSLTVLYDPFLIHKKNKISTTASDFIKNKLELAFENAIESTSKNGEQIVLPVCYDGDFGSDLPFITEATHLSKQEIIEVHLSKIYRVYMMGFLPGFAYMGKIDERIQVPRKQKPVNVLAGSVGIAGGQTGIYPLDSPGGWQIIGRTPIKLFDPNAEQPVKLKAGQQVQFKRIDEDEFAKWSLV